MKSFFKFLSRNKAYAAINVVGLSISLMFLIIIGAYVWQETRVDRWHSNGDNVYALCLRDSTEIRIGNAWMMQFKLRDRFPEIVNSCAVADPRTNVVDRGLSTADDDVRGGVMMVDSTFFSVFDFELERGDRNAALRSMNSAVITAEFGRKLFGDEDPIGKRLRFSGDSTMLEVTGIMKPMKNTSFAVDNNRPVDMLMRLEHMRTFNPTVVSENMNNALGCQVFLVAQDGVDLKGRVKDYNAYAKEFFWILSRGSYELDVVNLNDLYFTQRDLSPCLTSGDKDFVNVLFVVGIVILIFALLNYINLTVAQSSWRAKEMATRRLIGASRASVAWRLIFESGILTLVSLALAIVLSVLATPFASSLLEKSIRLQELLNPVIIAVAFFSVAIIAVAAGVVPAMVISSVKPIDIVRGTFRRRTGSVYSRIFIVVQNAVTIVMLVSVLTMWLQTQHLKNAPMGFNTKKIVMIAGMGKLAHKFKSEVKNLSCVEAVGLCQGTPIDGGNNLSVTHEGRLISNQIIRMDTTALKIFGIEFERKTDIWGHFVNRRFLGEFGIDETANEVNFGRDKMKLSGVVRDFRTRNILEPSGPVVVHVVGNIITPWSVVIKVRGDEQEAWNQIVECFNNMLGGGLNFAEWVDTPYVDQILASNFREEERLVKIVAVFAMVALLISALGLIAMSSFYVNLRRKEIAVRKVYGATSAEELMRILRLFLSNVVVAIVVAVPAGWYVMADWLAGYSYRIDLSWWIFAAAGLVCLVISLLVVLVQSARAANANPSESLYQN